MTVATYCFVLALGLVIGRRYQASGAESVQIETENRPDRHSPSRAWPTLFGKKSENHFYTLAIYFIRMSKALWSMDDVVKMVEEREADRMVAV